MLAIHFQEYEWFFAAGWTVSAVIPVRAAGSDGNEKTIWTKILELPLTNPYMRAIDIGRTTRPLRLVNSSRTHQILHKINRFKRL